jgi:hypothetical protein
MRCASSMTAGGRPTCASMHPQAVSEALLLLRMHATPTCALCKAAGYHAHVACMPRRSQLCVLASARSTRMQSALQGGCNEGAEVLTSHHCAA